MPIRRAGNIHWTNQGERPSLYYSASLFRRDHGAIIDGLHSATLAGLFLGIREVWGGLRPGRLVMISRHITNFRGGALASMPRAPCRKPYGISPNSRWRKRRLAK